MLIEDWLQVDSYRHDPARLQFRHVRRSFLEGRRAGDVKDW